MSRISALLACSLTLPAALPAAAPGPAPIALPAPQRDGGRPLMQVLDDRRSSREFSPRVLSPQELSNLLWAAFGVNRPDSGRRTAPSAHDWREVEIYVATAEGLYLYEAQRQRLRPLLSRDLRALTGQQTFVRDAPVNLVYVADFARMGPIPEQEKELYAAAGTGAIAENVYLYCASAGLATVLRGAIDRPALGRALGLRPDQRIILAQSVGYPKP